MRPLDARLAAVADNYINQNLYAGIAWHVEQSGQVIAQGASGTSDETRNTPLEEDSIYRIYSMTKPIVSFMALILIERSKLRLSDFVGHYIPAFNNSQVYTENGLQPPVRPMTIEDLLTHRSGISYDFIPDCPIAQQYTELDLLNRADLNLETFANQIAAIPLAFHPGTKWRYSYSTDVLARVLEVASGQPIDQLLAENIFLPLDMKDTGYSVAANNQARLLPLFGFESIDLSFEVPPAHDLNLLDGEAVYPSRTGHNTLRGGHGLFSTSADYSKFATMLLTGCTSDGTPLVSPAMHELMLANRIPDHQLPLALGPKTYAGYGHNLIGRVMQDLGQARNLTAAGEFGWEGAAGTYFWVDRKNQLVGIIMSQFLGTYLPFREDMQSAVYTLLK